MELIETILTKTGIEAAYQAAKEFLIKIAGPAAEETGLLLQDKIRLYRLKNQIKMLAKAQKMLNDAGVSPKSVPLRTLLPLLEGAALEDDDGLSTKWAALLANAANPNFPYTVHPSFTNILRQLSPHDAKVVDLIYDKTPLKKIGYRQLEKHSITFKLITDKINISENEFYSIMENLVRLGLCLKFPAGPGYDFEEEINTRRIEDRYSISQFGYEFVTACRQQ